MSGEPADREPPWERLEELAPFGAEAVELDVAGIRAALEGLNPPQAISVRQRYGVFAGGAGGAGGIRIGCRLDPGPGYLSLTASGGPELYRLPVARRQGQVRGWSYRFAGWFREEERRGILALCDPDGWGFDTSVENFLRLLFAGLALGRGGFLLHGATVVRDGRAYLFFGPSGSGKTTSARLSRGALVLSDDLSLVLPDGPGGAPRAASLPFRGHHAEVARQQESFPIAGFFRLVKAADVGVEPLGAARGVGELVGSLPFVTEVPENGPAVLAAVGAAAAAAPVMRLRFRKDPGFWSAIEAWERSRKAGGWT